MQSASRATPTEAGVASARAAGLGRGGDMTKSVPLEIKRASDGDPNRYTA